MVYNTIRGIVILSIGFGTAHRVALSTSLESVLG